MAKEKKASAQVAEKIEKKTKKGGGFFRFLFILAILALLVVFLRKQIGGSEEKSS